MKMSFVSPLIALAILLSLPQTLPAQSQARKIVDEMIRSMDATKTMTGKLKRKERYDGGYVTGEMDVKLMVSPFKVYLYNHHPDEGAEILWAEGLNDNKALVYPGKFPYVNLNLDIRGNIMTKKQHHNIESVGFGKMSRIVKSALKKHGQNFDKYVSLKGTATHDGRTCDIVQIDYTDFKYVNYTVKAGEDLWSIGKKMDLPEYRIQELNPGIRNYEDVKAGQVLKIPSDYAPKVIFYVDRQTKLPIKQEIHDELGLYEQYSYYNIRKNPKFTADEFMPHYKDYSFIK